MNLKATTIYRAVSRFNRIFIVNKLNKRKLKNSDFTILSNNCVGSLISHDLKQPFLTPTVNLFMGTKDFVKFLARLQFYLNQEVVEKKMKNINYPVGVLYDIEIHFMHFKNFEEAKEKWKIRSQRINLNNTFVIMTENDNCEAETLVEFEKLPYKNKVFLTNKKYKGHKSTYFMPGFEKEEFVGDLTVYKNIFGQKLYDNFNYIDFLNSK